MARGTHSSREQHKQLADLVDGLVKAEAERWEKRREELKTYFLNHEAYITSYDSHSNPVSGVVTFVETATCKHCGESATASGTYEWGVGAEAVSKLDRYPCPKRPMTRTDDEVEAMIQREVATRARHNSKEMREKRKKITAMLKRGRLNENELD